MCDRWAQDPRGQALTRERALLMRAVGLAQPLMGLHCWRGQVQRQVQSQRWVRGQELGQGQEQEQAQGRRKQRQWMKQVPLW